MRGGWAFPYVSVGKVYVGVESRSSLRLFLLGEPVTLDMVYREVKGVRMLLEELVERSLLNVLPEEELSVDELRELKEAEEEIGRGEYVTLEEAEKKLKAR